MSNEIHATAVVAPGARLGKGNRIGPFAVIEDDVELGDDNKIHAHAVLKRGCRLGDANAVHEHAVIGGLPQDIGFTERPSFVVLGDRNVLREGVTVHRATREEGSTRLGSDNFLMVNVHLGHDCQFGDHVIVATGSGFGGHVTVADRAVISGGVMVHQHARIGRFAMIGGNTKLTQDALPFMITDGVPGEVRGLNAVGLKRGGFSVSDLRALKQAYRTLFRASGSLEAHLSELAGDAHPLVSELAEFIAGSKRGFHRAGAERGGV